MPARYTAPKPMCARWRQHCHAKIPSGARWGDGQWTLLCVALTVATRVCLAPSAQRQAELVFVRPTRADLLLPARNKDAHLSRQFRSDVLDRLSAQAALHCGVGGEARSALFAHNFVLRASSGQEHIVDAHAVHFCGDPGETMVDLQFEPAPGAAHVSCAEQYVDFKSVVRPAAGFLTYASVEDGYRRVRRAARNAAEACLAQHAVEILESRWA